MLRSDSGSRAFCTSAIYAPYMSYVVEELWLRILRRSLGQRQYSSCTSEKEPARAIDKAHCDRFAGPHATACHPPRGRLHRASRMVAKTPRLLTAEQRDAFVRIPTDLSERDLGRFYTLSARDLEIIGRHRRAANRL